MKKSFLKIAAPTLAIGLALSAHGGVLAASPNASAQAKVASVHTKAHTEVKTKQVPSQVKNSTLVKRLAPVENRVATVESEISKIVSELNTKETLTIEEFASYQERLTSLSNRLKASTYQLNAISKKFGSGSLAVVNAKTSITTSLGAVSSAKSLLASIEVVPASPVTEVPTETPATP